MDKKEIVKLYASNRKFPAAIKIGKINREWIDYALKLESQLPESKGESYEYRASQNIPGTEIDDINGLRKFYSQKLTSDLNLPDEIAQFEGLHHLRFARLESNSTIPEHLDDPRYLRFICVLKGSHRYVPEKNNDVLMSEGELWFVNGSYRHSVENLQNQDRVALLGNFSNNEKNNLILKGLINGIC
jgi:hypothetical protein